MAKTDMNSNSTVSDAGYGASTTNDQVIVKDSSTYPDVLQFPELEPEIQDAIKEKGLEEALAFGPESFEDLEALREHNEKQSVITQKVSDFMSLVGNIFAWPQPNQAKRVKELAQELADRIPGEDEEEEDTTKESEEEVDSVDDDTRKNGFFVWKEADGTYRWLGVYSNKFRDDDRPAEILSEQSHIDFIERVEKGELAYPDLYVWHIKSPIGVADLLAYDDAGFSIASGTIQEEFALALEKTSEDLAMSHGMPSEFIKRSEEDPTVITSYVSTEVSVLPRRVAANKRTDFSILKEEEATMSIVPADKRQQVTALLGEDLTAELETGLDGKAKKAEAENVESKEESVDTDVAEEAVAEAEAEVTEEPAVEEEAEAEAEVLDEEKEEEAEEAVAEEVTEDVTDATPEGAVGDEAADGNEFVDKGELAETLALVVSTITESNVAVLEAVKQMNERIQVLETGGSEQEASVQANEQLAELAASVPMASLKEMFMKSLAEPAQSVIGTKEAKLHGNNKLDKAQPKETEFDEKNPDPNSGLFFHRW